MRTIVAFSIITSVLILMNLTGFAQKTTKNNFTGTWESNTSWTGGTAAQTTGIDNSPADLDLTINGYITRNGSLSFANVNADASGPDFIVNDTLVIKGDLTFDNKSANLILGSNAILIVFGNFDATNKILVANGGILVVTGNMTFSASGNDTYDNSAGGELFAGGTVSGNTAANTDNDWSNLDTLYPDISEFVESGGSGSLPVELISFSVTSFNETVELNWRTASQLNFSHFELEHSNNAKQWSTLGAIEGEGTTDAVNNYSFTHTSPNNGKNYYRLRMVDLDNTVEYSSVESIVVSANASLKISPNPSVGEKVMCYLNFEVAEGDILTFYDVTGSRIHSLPIQSTTQEVVFTTPLKKGTYLVQYKGKDFTKVARLLVD